MLGEIILKWSIVDLIHDFCGSKKILRPASLAASPHLTGTPISLSFSNTKTSIPWLAAYFAAVVPAGPPPTITRSKLFWGHDKRHA